ncbi:hypothetical protein IWW50_007001, partial [Coemansia erecta]
MSRKPPTSDRTSSRGGAKSTSRPARAAAAAPGTPDRSVPRAASKSARNEAVAPSEAPGPASAPNEAPGSADAPDPPPADPPARAPISYAAAVKGPPARAGGGAANANKKQRAQPSPAAIAERLERPYLLHPVLHVTIPDAVPNQMDEVAEHVLGVFNLPPTIPLSSPEHPIANCAHGTNRFYIQLRNREDYDKLAAHPLVVDDETFPWATKEGTMTPVVITCVPLHAAERHLVAAMRDDAMKLSDIKPVPTSKTTRFGDWS